MGRDGGFFQKLGSVTDLQDEPLPGLPLVELAGDRRVLIEKHMGVTEYARERIVVRVKFGHICVSGCNLVLARMTKSQLVISGTIDGVHIIRGCR